MPTVEEVFSKEELLQIWRGLWHYKLTEIKQWSWYANRIENVLKENKNRLRKGYIDLNNTGKILNIKDPENWIKNGHLPPDVEKMKIYHQFVEIVAPEYLSANDDGKKYIEAGDVFSRFSKVNGDYTPTPSSERKSVVGLCYAETLTIEMLLDVRNLYRLITFKKIAGSEYLMAYRFELNVTLEDVFGANKAANIRKLEVNIKRKNTSVFKMIKEHFSKISAKDIGGKYSISNLQIGIIVPHIGIDCAFHGILQTRNYQPNHIDLRPMAVSFSEDNNSLVFNTTLDPMSDDIFYSQVHFKGLDDFLATLGGPVL